MKKHIIVNQAGPSHLQKGVPCQDSVYIKYVSSDIVVAAVADGLGSEKHSDIGSKIASKVAVEHIASNYSSDMKYDKVKSLMNNSFVYAYKAVLDKVEEMNEDPDQFNTTLCLAILDGKHLYVGQSGDSGMIALLQDGAYINCTEKQNDEEGCVWPLCSGPKHWVFREIDAPVCSVMLATDGIYDRFVNGLIKYDERVISGHRFEVNVPFAEKLMRRTESTDEEIDELSNSINDLFLNYPKEKIDDDKSLVLIFDSDLDVEKMPEEYYEPLDYESLHKKALDVFRKALGYDQDEDSNKSYEDTVEVTAEDESGTTEMQDTFNDVHNDSKASISSDSVANKNKQDNKTTSAAVTFKDDCSKKEVSGYRGASSNGSLQRKRGTFQRKTEEKANKKTTTTKSSMPISKKKTIIYDAVVLSVLLLFGVVAFFASDLIRKYSTASYIGILFFSFLSNSTVLLPAPSSLVVIEYSLILNPFLVAILGGLGAAVGEMTGFLVGYHSKRIISHNKRFRSLRILEWIERKFKSHPYLLVFIFSLIPFPVFDIVGIMSGAAKLKPTLFFASTLIGKTIKMLFYVIVAMNISPLIENGSLSVL